MCLTPMTIKRDGKLITVPCSHCAECWEQLRISWIIRLTEHKKLYEKTAFVTYTYSNENLRFGESENGSLYPRDMQLYFKSLRKSIGNKRISYYMVGEYGTMYMRPHYHVILFGLGFEDYEEISKHWKLGHVYVLPLTDAAIGYVCKYHLLRGENPVGCYPSFSRMSKKIGYNYVEKNESWHNEQIKSRDFYWLKGKKVMLPRYFKDRIYSKRDREDLGIKNQKLANDKMLKESVKESGVNYFKNKDYQIKMRNTYFHRKKGGKL